MSVRPQGEIHGSRGGVPNLQEKSQQVWDAAALEMEQARQHERAMQEWGVYLALQEMEVDQLRRLLLEEEAISHDLSKRVMELEQARQAAESADSRCHQEVQQLKALLSQLRSSSTH
mmetsp:Transcript_11180/g.20338  ORF Transcript_11180/g.20338 Transcript_11180/m.20338 type:complete len:117 (-) Transcript_11180:63-413(-)